ncbi:A/G-specific adenine glycosylase [Candidatus Gottesmanbacteria bacterium]|nr:A/G-specific adenine glycosylase [Candidatus Gottesmanbacteria bacterium]
MKLAPKQIKEFQNKIFSWWDKNMRDLPWRHTHDPYKILISEVMLQQTQVSRVITKYREFIATFPTVGALAKASISDVLKIWKGMGYNRRALYLKQAAQVVVERYGEKFPKSEKELIKLPGLGTYTVRALLVFAYKQNVACVDTNIRRIITHFFFDDKPQKPSVIQSVADQLMPKGKAWEWHQALMDYGALAMPNAKCQMLNKEKKKTIPFKESNRFYRGRIIDRLREGNIRESMIIREFQKKYGKSREFMRSILSGLKNDGLLARFAHGTIGLPRG